MAWLRYLSPVSTISPPSTVSKRDYTILLIFASLGAIFTCVSLLWLMNKQNKLIAALA
jgi:hypothetical protein